MTITPSPFSPSRSADPSGTISTGTSRRRRCHRHQRQLAAPGQLSPRVEKTRRDPVATRDLRRRGARPKRLGHQRQLLLAGPATPPFGLRQDLRHRFCGHLKRGRKGLFIWQRGQTAKLYLADEIRKAAVVRRLRLDERGVTFRYKDYRRN